MKTIKTTKALKFKTDCILIEFTVSPLLNEEVSKKLWKEFSKRTWTSKGIKLHDVMELTNGTTFAFYFKTTDSLSKSLDKIQSFIQNFTYLKTNL